MCLYPVSESTIAPTTARASTHFTSSASGDLDKFWVVEFLTSRWNTHGLPDTLDEADFVNFYDAFPEDMSYLFGHYASDQIQHAAPRASFRRIGQPSVEFRTCGRATAVTDRGWSVIPARYASSNARRR